MLKNLLVHISSERSFRPVIDYAVSLASGVGAHLDAVATGYESVSSGIVIEGGAAMVSVMELERERALERANAAIAIFESEASRAGIVHGCRAFCAIPAEAGETMGALARLYDLTVVLQPEPAHLSFEGYIPLQVLLHSGGPVLMVPYIHKGAFDASHVGIAWDGSRLAARALRDAMPFLKAAKSVTVIAVNEARKGTENASSADLAVQLRRHGIEARIERLTTEGSNIHNAILSTVADNAIGLLVMGGFGHSRLREVVLGGVTQGIFESMTIPTLMSH